MNEHERRVELLMQAACDQVVTVAELLTEQAAAGIEALDAEVLAEAEAMTSWAAQSHPEIVQAALHVWGFEEEELRT